MKSVLIVDDYAENRYLLEKLLQANNYETLSAANGSEALDRATERPPDLVIADILMPVMDGFALCREWRRRDKLRRIPFIFYTATYTDPKDEEFALSLGADRFLVKPMEMDAFLSAVHDTLGVNGATASPAVSTPQPDEEIYLKEYNETLVRKLETKMGQLERAEKELLKKNAALERDIEQRKRTEAALQESEEISRILIATVPDMLVRTDLRGTITLVNENVVPLLRYLEDADLREQNMLAMVADKDKARFADHLAAMLDHQLGPQEYTLIGGDGTPIDCDMNGSVLRHHNGSAFGLVFIIRDLTEKKKMQSQLFQSQKMEAVGRLAGGVAHDFNNMLGVILGYASMIERELPVAHPSHGKIKSILSAAERSSDLTKQLLAFARQQIIAPVVLNVNDELSSFRRMLGRLIGEDVTLVCTETDGLWNIKIDPTQLTQLLTNLVTNARDAIENTGTINIETSNLFLRRTRASEQGDIPPGEYVILSFADSGEGMDARTMAQIFEPFFTTKPIHKGTGLGLSTVFGIMKQNNGYITVSSELRKGTRFTLYFPRSEEEAECTGDGKEDGPVKGTETVLIVEDEDALLALSKYTLEMEGYNVLTAASPAEAMQKCEETTGPIDLLITDVVMPGMNGIEMKKWMEAKYRSVKTLLVSGYTSDIVAQRGVLEEGMHFLQKPFTGQVLLKTIRAILNEA